MVPHSVFASAGGAAQTAPQSEPEADVPVPSQGGDALPVDLPDEVDARVPEFRSRRKAKSLPALRPVGYLNALDPSWCRRLAWADWMSGFRWGVVATLGGVCLFAVVALQVLK